MSTTEPITQTGQGVKLEAHVNGTHRARVIAFALDGPEPRHVLTDTVDLTSAQARETWAARLPEPLRAEAVALAHELGAHLAQRRSQPAGETDAPEVSDDALALAFTERHGDDLRYIAAWGRWMRWDADRWREDTTLTAFDLARAVCREHAERCEKPATRTAILRANTVAAVERLARADRRHAATAEQFDADPWLLNTPGGTIDLRTGTMRAHARTDYLTKCAAVGPGGPRTRWLEFLKWVTQGDGDLEAFLQRWFGYCLTGSTREEKLVFGYGDGGNGKGTLVGTIQHILGDYAMTSQMETFTLSREDRHPTELAALRGARLVVAQETQQGRAWNEARLKALTGGDKIQARYMRQDFFEFAPTFKLVLFGNHKPSLRNVDAAIRRRLLLVPFTAHVTQQDDRLKERLREEAGGILEWMIDGCIAWQRDGLGTPARVLDATEQYLTSQDSFGEWLATCCVVTPEGQRDDRWAAPWTSSTLLFESWRRFADATGIPAGTAKAFGQELEMRGFPRGQGGPLKKARGFYGLTLDEQPLQLHPPRDYRDVA